MLGATGTLLLIVFVLLAIGLLFLKKSVAIVLWLISGHFDLGVGSIGGGLSQLPYLNGVKILGFPAWLAIRARNTMRREIRLNVPVTLWCLFVLYAALSLLWTPDRFVSAGIKQLGYLISYSLSFLVLYLAWRRGDVTAKSVMILIIVSSALAVVQTYILGNAYGRTLDYARYVSFTAKQQFGEFLFASISFLLFAPHAGKVLKPILILGLWAQLFLNGSRAALFGAFVTLLVYVLARRGIKAILIALSMVSIAAAAYIGKDSLLTVASQVTRDSRLGEIVNLARSTHGIEEVGTLKARLDFWESTIQRMKGWPLISNAFGKGISSAGDLVREKDFSRLTGTVVTSDPNRVVHNEFLRVKYELGLIGFLILCSFILSLLFRLSRTDMPPHAKRMLVGFAPGFLLFLFMENVLTGSGAAGGIGFMLVLSYVFAATRESTK